MVGLSGSTLKPVWALEIKWSNRYFEKPGELKSLFKFCQENNLDHPLVTTIDKEGEINYKNLNIQYIPASAYAYTIGRNTLDRQKNK